MVKSPPHIKKKVNDRRESGYTLFSAFTTVPCVHVRQQVPDPRLYQMRIVNKNAQGHQRVTFEWQEDSGEKRRSSILLFTGATVVNGSIHIRCKSPDSRREYELIVFRFGHSYKWHAVESPNPDALCVEFSISNLNIVQWREVFANEVVIHPVNAPPDIYNDLWVRVNVPEKRRAVGVVAAFYIITLDPRYPVIWKEVDQRGGTCFFADDEARATAYAYEPLYIDFI